MVHMDLAVEVVTWKSDGRSEMQNACRFDFPWKEGTNGETDQTSNGVMFTNSYVS